MNWHYGMLATLGGPGSGPQKGGGPSNAEVALNKSQDPVFTGSRLPGTNSIHDSQHSSHEDAVAASKASVDHLVSKGFKVVSEGRNTHFGKPSPGTFTRLEHADGRKASVQTSGKSQKEHDSWVGIVPAKGS